MEEIKINPLAEIKSVKVSGNGYLLNGTMSVPVADGNREMGIYLMLGTKKDF